MPPENDLPPEALDRLAAIERQISEIAARMGYDSPPDDDPVRARRWDAPLWWHLSNLSDHLHALRNFIHVLSGLLASLSGKLDRNASISEENSRSISRLVEISRKIEASSLKIEREVGYVARDQPLLLRDIYWLDTNTVEIGLILYTAGEAMVFLIESDALLRSAMFRSISVMCDSPVVWGLGVGLLSLGSALAFGSRRRDARLVAVFLNAIFFCVTGIIPLFLAGGILGWLPHLLAGFGAIWVLSRGPSSSI